MTLGKAEIYLNGRTLPGLKSAKARAILYYLAVTGRSVSRMQLAGLLWPDMPEEKARVNLRQALAQLRRSLPDHVDISREMIALRPEAAVELDYALFERAASAALVAEDTAGLETAVQYYGGDFLDGLPLPDRDGFTAWALGIREHLRGMVLQALHILSRYYAKRRAITPAIHYTRQLLEMEPWREEAHRQMMRLLVWDGQISAALAQYKRCRKILLEELGVEPMESTTALFERIRQLRSGTPSNLPAESTPFVGREAELAAFADLLAHPEVRLICVTGVGGVGKTRFAQQAARAQQGRFLDGVYWISLYGINETRQLPAAIAEAANLSLAGRQTPQKELLEALRQKEMLLLLDNFEHLLAAAPLLSEIIAAAPEVALVVTSRERLNVRGEYLFPLDGLPAPAGANRADLAKSAAAQLFTQAAQRFRPDFSPDREWEAIGAICRQVGGLPLALELAASWITVHSCADIAASITHNLDFLKTRLRDMPARHASLHTTLAGSWQLLSSAEQSRLARLAVFQGQFTRQAATAVSGASEWQLAALVDKSLLIRTKEDCFTLHPLVRQFCLTQLEEAGQTETARAAHQAYYLDWLQEKMRQARGEAIVSVTNQLRQARKNFLAAWEYALERKDWAALTAVYRPLAHFFTLSNLFAEGTSVFQKAAKRLEGETAQTTRLRAAFLVKAASLMMPQGRHMAAYELAQQILAGDPAIAGRETRGYALLVCGETLYLQDRYKEAQPVLEEAAALFAAIEHADGAADAQRYLAAAYYRQGMPEKGRQCYETALRRYRANGNLILENAVLNNLFLFDYCAHRIGEEDLARMEEIIRANRRMGNLWGESFALSNLGNAWIHLGQYEKAIACHRQALRIRRETGNPSRIASSLRALGIIASRQGKIGRSLTFLRQAVDITQRHCNDYAAAAMQLELGRVLAADGRLAEAEAAYREVKRVFAGNPAPISLKAEAGLIQLLLLQNKQREAARRAEKLYGRLNEKVLLSTAASTWILWVCRQALLPAKPLLAKQALAQAGRLAQRQLDRLQTEALRRSFRQSAPYLQDILNAIEQEKHSRRVTHRETGLPWSGMAGAAYET